MRLLVVFLVVFSVSAAIDIPLPIPIPVKIPDIPLPLDINELTDAVLEGLFEQFMKVYNKKYADQAAQSKALSTFSENVKKIVGLNSAHKDTNVTYGINEFTDLTDEEFAKKMLQDNPFNSPNFASYAETNFTVNDYQSSPASFDWRKTANVVGPVRNQGSCGCCWAFTTAALIQSAYGIKYKKLVQPSEQQICDCGMMNSQPGCNGGNVGVALKYAVSKGVSLETAYDAYNPSRATKPNVCADSNKPNTIKIASYKPIRPVSAVEMQPALVKNGPLAVAFKVGSSFRYYKSGVFNNNDCSTASTFLGWHAVAVVGYGDEKGTPYWIVKNSWGPSFGESGYVRFVKGTKLCSLETADVYYASA